MKKIIVICIMAIFLLAGILPTISGSLIKQENKTEGKILDKEESKETNDYYSSIYAYAQFTWSPKYPDPGEEITFRSTSYASNGWITNQRWDFGEGYTQYGKTAKYTFEEKGTYLVRLHVEAHGFGSYPDYYYDWDSDYCTHYIEVGADPFPRFSINPENPAPGENITLDASESSDPDGEIVSYNWSYYEENDQNNITMIGSDKTINYNFEEQGIYNIKLSIEDDKGNQNEIEKTLHVSILKIEEIKEGIGELDFGIKNQGEITAENLTWDIEITRYTLTGLRTKQLYQETGANRSLKSKDIKSIIVDELKAYGDIRVDITAEAGNAIKVSKTKYGFIYGENIYLSEYAVNRINTIIKAVIIGTMITSSLLIIFSIIKNLSHDTPDS